MTYKDLPPFAPTLMESTRAIGYSTETAIADIIDNSVSAEADIIEIDFMPSNTPYVSILDNGAGMDDQNLVQAMQYGSKNPLESRDIEDLGRYGLGLKTASLSQCKILTVISKRNNMINGCQWNLDHIKKTQSWSLILLDNKELNNFPNIEKLKNLKSGTLVIWQDLDKFFLKNRNISEVISKKCIATINHLSLVFHRYLNGEKGINKIHIFVNNSELKGKDPFLYKKSAQIMSDEIIKIDGSKIIVKPFILPHTSSLTQLEIKELGDNETLKKQQGFYIYRNKRLLVWGTWFKLIKQNELSKLARVQVDIPNTLDDLWTLDIKKSTAVPPDEVKKNLSIIINKIVTSSHRTYTYRGRKELDDKTINLWNRLKTREGGVEYILNKEHPLIQNIIEKQPLIKKELNLLLDQISNSLPINSIYVDLNQDQKINENRKSNYETILEMLQNLINSQDKFNVKLIDNLKKAQPFCNYIDEINESIKRGDLN